jgi:hypothetical protein
VTGSGDKKGGRPASGRKLPGVGGGRDELPRRLGDIITPALDRLAGGALAAGGLEPARHDPAPPAPPGLDAL